MGFRVYLAVAVLLVGFIPSSAVAKWVEVRSENFIFRGDVRAKHAESLVRDLELYRANVLNALGVSGKAELKPVPVYAVRGAKQIKALTGTGSVAGLYQNTLRGPAYVIIAKPGFRRDNRATKIALHEYAHHLIAVYSGDPVPSWFNEGYAEYLSTYSDEAGQFTLGAPRLGHSYPLKRMDWMPMATVLGAVRDYPFNRTKSSKANARQRVLFYAQSWLAVHYILNHEDMQKHFKTYVKALSQREDPVTVFEETFGISADAFQKTLKAYLKTNKFRTMTFAGQTLDDIPLTTTTLSGADGDYVMAEAARYFSHNDAGRARAQKLFDAVESGSNYSAEALAGKADLAAKAGNFEVADAFIKDALLQAPDNVEVQRTAGEILIAEYNETRKIQTLSDANQYFDKVLTTHPRDPTAHYYYAVGCAQLDCPKDRALASARLARHYFRNAHYAGSQLNLAALYIKHQDYAAARDVVDFANDWGRDMPVRNEAQRLSRFLEKQGY